MGYCYDSQGRLVCDGCGKTGGVRKCRCPFGYCPPPALCETCRELHGKKLTRAYHREMGCEKGHNEFVDRMTLTTALMDEGIWVRVAARGEDQPSLVRVWFERAVLSGRVTEIQRRQLEQVECVMPADVYHALPLLDVTTLWDYENAAGRHLDVGSASERERGRLQALRAKYLN